MGEGLARMRLGAAADALAPDGSEIRLLPKLAGGSMAHCTLPAGATSKAVKHRRVEEIWYMVSGRGEVWRKRAGHEEVVEVEPGVGLSIPYGTEFQFRALGPEPLVFVLVTMPPWPGEAEAVRVADHWPVE
jgi:mannose-6-phosphate isomerase-like protein (cupin superfamily)